MVRRSVGLLWWLHDNLVHIAKISNSPLARTTGQAGDWWRENASWHVCSSRSHSSDMAADQAFTQVEPCVAHLQALLAALRARGDITNLVEVCTLLCYRSPPSLVLQLRSICPSFRPARLVLPGDTTCLRSTSAREGIRQTAFAAATRSRAGCHRGQGHARRAANSRQPQHQLPRGER